MTSVLQGPTLVTFWGNYFKTYTGTNMLRKWARGKQIQINAQWHMAKSQAWLRHRNFQLISSVPWSYTGCRLGKPKVDLDLHTKKTQSSRKLHQVGGWDEKRRKTLL